MLSGVDGPNAAAARFGGARVTHNSLTHLSLGYEQSIRDPVSGQSAQRQPTTQQIGPVIVGNPLATNRSRLGARQR
jgi:hypothetical protein